MQYWKHNQIAYCLVATLASFNCKSRPQPTGVDAAASAYRVGDYVYYLYAEEMYSFRADRKLGRDSKVVHVSPDEMRRAKGLFYVCAENDVRASIRDGELAPCHSVGPKPNFTGERVKGLVLLRVAAEQLSYLFLDSDLDTLKKDTSFSNENFSAEFINKLIQDDKNSTQVASSDEGGSSYNSDTYSPSRSYQE